MPFRAGWSSGKMSVDWCHLGARRFADPFFHQTIARAMSEPFNLAFQQRTPIERLAEIPRGLPVAGFIFHLSRCGSTLCAQALATLPENVVISEAAPIHAVLRAPEFGPATDSEAVEWLTGMVNAFAQPRSAEEKRVIIKFVASDALYLPLIARAFPQVPWIFLYRDPLAILASHGANAGPEFMPGRFAPLHLALEGIETLDEDTYRAHCLARVGQAALTAGRDNPRALFLNYRDLPEAIFDRLPGHFGISFNDADSAAILETTQRNAKNPGAPYLDDTAAKDAAAAPLRAMAEAIVGPTIAALDAARQSQCRSSPA
jgi:gluconate kinase